MGLFDKLSKKRNESKSHERTTQSELTVKDVNEETIIQKPKGDNEEPFDMEVIKKFRADRIVAMTKHLKDSEIGNVFDIEGQLQSTLNEWEENNRPLTDEELSQALDSFSITMDKESARAEYEIEQLYKHQMYISKNNGEAFKALKAGDLAKATALFEKNVEALDMTTISYSYLVDIYRYNEDYNNELRICDTAIENLVGSPHLKNYIPRREEVFQRINGGGFYSNDEVLFAIVKREERIIALSHLVSNYYQTDKYKEAHKYMEQAKKLYLQKYPTNFLIYGTKIYHRNWSSLYKESDEIRTLISIAGEAKYLEDNGNYENAIKVYEEANKIDKKFYPNKESNQIDKRIEICQNKIQKQQIKDLEAKAKGLEKEDPAKAIELYNELNILNPNLKKYDKRIEILNKKIGNDLKKLNREN